MLIAISESTEAKLRRKAADEGRDIHSMADALLATVLDRQTTVEPTSVEPDLNAPPFRPDPRLRGIQYHEDPAAPLDPADWPEAFD